MECFQKGSKATVGRVQCLEAPPEGSRQPGSPGAQGLSAPLAVGDTRPSRVYSAQSLPRAPAWRFGRLVDLHSSNHSTIFLLHSSNSVLPKSWVQVRLRMPKKGLSLKLDWRPDRGRFLWLLGSCRDSLTLSLVRGTL